MVQRTQGIPRDATAVPYAASFQPNLVRVLPVGALSLMVCARFVVDVVRRARAAPEAVSQEESPAPVGQAFIGRYRPAVLMALFALYVMTLPWLGFDVGSAVFVAAALVMDGERRLWLDRNSVG